MKRYGLIGFPLAHSFSSSYFTERFRREGVDASYTNFPLASIDDFPALIDSVGPFNGLNVTIPYKERIISYLDSLDSTAAEIGAVNLIKFSGEGKHIKMTGYNTDADGFTGSLRFFNIPIPEMALVLGTGGASKAVTFVLQRLGASVTLVSRSAVDGHITYHDLERSGLKGYGMIVNTTPVGMFPDTDHAPPLPYKALEPGITLYDLIYNPEETLFMKRGREKGCKVYNGLKMLHLQAEKGWNLWEGANHQ